MRRAKRFDIIFLGGGLANGLAAYRLAMAKPQTKMLVLEEQQTLGGHHTWCFHESDLAGLPTPWPRDLADQSWDSYDVRFPNLKRTLNSRYYTLRSATFHKKIMDQIGGHCRLGVKVTQIYEDQVFLNTGEVISGSIIVDGRGITNSDSPQAYQKFLGRYLELATPHGLERPVLMDTCVDQHGEYRFVYLLPVSATEILVEDTYYSNSALLDEESLRTRIDAYVKAQGWHVAAIIEEESGVLPLPFWSHRSGVTSRRLGRAPISRFEHASVIPSGMRAGLFHPTTGYSFPAALQFAEAIAKCNDLTSPKTRAALMYHIEDHQQRGTFYRRLNNMMFIGAKPDQRRRILEQFYGRGEGLIQRFYAHRSTRLDKLRMLIGVPPIPAKRGIQTFFQPVEVES